MSQVVVAIRKITLYILDTFGVVQVEEEMMNMKSADTMR